MYSLSEDNNNANNGQESSRLESEGLTSSEGNEYSYDGDEADYNRVEDEHHGDLAQVGDKVGKMGIYVEHPSLSIDWSAYADHGNKRLIERGISQSVADAICANGKVLSQNNGAKYVFITKEGVVITAANGKIITAWGKDSFDTEMLAIIEMLFGKKE